MSLWKKIIAILLVICMFGTLCSCGGKNRKAFELSKEAYENIKTAYDIIDSYALDIYEAWRLGIYDDDKISVDYLSTELNLSADELTEGVVWAVSTLANDVTYETMSEDQKQELREFADLCFDVYAINLGSKQEFCVYTVNGAYTTNGSVEKIQQAIDAAKKLMKDLSDSYSDYEHYPSLKGYYTTTCALFDLCQNPTGSFEQMSTSMNNYRSEARDYVNDLNFIFEE